PCRIDEVERRPVVIAKPTPDRAVVVDGDRVRHAPLLCRLLHVVDVFLEREFWCVDTDDDQPLLTVPGGPGANVRECAQPVDARVRPKVDEDDFALQVRRCEWRGSYHSREPAAVRGGELSQAVPPPSEARSLALESRNGFTLIICITESRVPIHAPASDSAAIPKKRRRSCRGCANIRLPRE